MTDHHGSERQAGSTVTELLVAATLTLVAVGMFASDAIPTLRHLTSAVEPDQRGVELMTGADVIARAVRAARPEATRPAILGDEQTLDLAMGDGTGLLITLDGGVVTIAANDPGGRPAPPDYPLGPLVDGLDVERSRFELVDRSGEAPRDGEPPAGVVVVLSDGDRSVVRIVASRLRTHLDGVGSW